MRHIAIITFHRTHNYGAALQSYALQCVLNQKYKAEILDYRSPYLEKLYLRNKTDIKTKIRGFIRKVVYPIRTRKLEKRRNRFACFYKQYHVLSSQTYDRNNVASASDVFDLFIAGSDQVWNPHMSRGDWNYFLEFTPACKRYSYAASIGISNSSEENERIKKDLNQFQSILVRENKAVDFLQFIGVNKVATAVCDPVFLLTNSEWKKILPVSEASRRDKYVLLYTVANVTKSLQFAKKLAEANNLTVIAISSNQSVKVVDGVKNVLDAGPIEFLEYIRNASYVVTSSFHALAFSIIFNIPFYYELCQDGSNNNDRLENIVDIFHLKDRELVTVEQADQLIKTDWEAVNLILKEYRQNSINILFDSLQDVRGDSNEQIQ